MRLLSKKEAFANLAVRTLPGSGVCSRGRAPPWVTLAYNSSEIQQETVLECTPLAQPNVFVLGEGCLTTTLFDNSFTM